jgi:hypothetical protein
MSQKLNLLTHVHHRVCIQKPRRCQRNTSAIRKASSSVGRTCGFNGVMVCRETPTRSADLLRHFTGKKAQTTDVIGDLNFLGMSSTFSVVVDASRPSSSER